MPLQKCQNNGVSGWRYGKSGHCYTGPGARAKAVKQGQAIEISRHSVNSNRELFLKALESIVEDDTKKSN